MKYLVVILTLFALSPKTAIAEIFKLGLLHADPEVFSYEISVLKLALANANGDHSLVIVPYPNTTQERIIKLLKTNPEDINVFFTANSPARDASLLRVNIPLTRGLLGYRVLVIKKSELPRYENINSLPDLRKLVIGSGLGWPENAVLKASGLTVIEAPYRNLWPMLVASRYDAFHRGIQEFSIELKQRANLNLTTIPDVMITFPFDYFFFVSKDNPHLRDILLEGLTKAYKNGSFMKNFNEHPSIRLAFEKGQIKQRKAIRIRNPFLAEDVRNIPDKYWYAPILK